MSWSLRIHNGDLDVSGTEFSTVTGSNKLVQDLRCFLLEHLNTDELHPDYGTTLEDFIGYPNNEVTQVYLESEIRRVVVAYQNSQLRRAKADKAVYGKTTFSRGEVLLTLNSITFQSDLDSMNVTLHITTADDVDLTLTLPF